MGDARPGHHGGRLRGEGDRTPDVQRLVRVVGKVALNAIGLTQGPQDESWRIRWLVAEWILDHADKPGGTIFENASAMYNQSAYYAKCSPVTSKRWIECYTCVLSPWALKKDLAGWLLTMRRREPDDGGAEA